MSKLTARPVIIIFMNKLLCHQFKNTITRATIEIATENQRYVLALCLYSLKQKALVKNSESIFKMQSHFYRVGFVQIFG